MEIVKLFALLVGSAYANKEDNELLMPPQSGKFFYMDLQTGEPGQPHFLNMEVGSPK